MDNLRRRPGVRAVDRCEMNRSSVRGNLAGVPRENGDHSGPHQHPRQGTCPHSSFKVWKYLITMLLSPNSIRLGSAAVTRQRPDTMTAARHDGSE